MDPLTIIIGGLVATTTYLTWNDYLAKKLLIESKQQLTEHEQEVLKNKINKINHSELLLSKFSNYLNGCTVIDSNIWMNEIYDSFFLSLFYACKKNKYQLELFGVQFDEITNIKKNSNYNTPQNRRARKAIAWIEFFQEAQLLKITKITIDAKKKAYADPEIVAVLAKKSTEGKFCTFFSDDQELKIRVRQKFHDKSNADWEIINMQKILPDCEKIAAGMKLKTELLREAAEEKPKFDVLLTDVGGQKIGVIKAIRGIASGLGLAGAKILIEKNPSKILEGVSKEEAEKAKTTLEEAGAKIELKETGIKIEIKKAAEEKAEFDVLLTDIGGKKIGVIKAIRQIASGLGFADAKKLSAAVPSKILEGVSKDDAEEAKTTLEEAGATVELKKA